MEIIRIALGAVVGTSFMTAFSYLYSSKRKRQFKEPELLNELLNRSLKSPLGWIVHYITGVAFVTGYYLVWSYTDVQVNISNATLMGLINGIVGCGVWEGVFRIHPAPPDIVIEEYFLQLVVAHVIFGMTAFCGYQLPVWFS